MTERLDEFQDLIRLTAARRPLIPPAGGKPEILAAVQTRRVSA